MQPNPSSAHEDLGMFEAAVHAEAIELTRRECKSIVAILDGSNQNETVQRLGDALKQRSGAALHVETKPDADAKSIMALCEHHNASLLIVPVPFGRNINELRAESLGSVVDILLQEAKCPVLCGRQPMEEEQVAQALKDVLIPILDLEKGHEKAAEWAFALLEKGEKLELLGVADETIFEEARQILGDSVDPEVWKADVLNRGVTRDIGGLVAAIQKQSSQAGISLHVEVKTGQPIDITEAQANARPRLTVVHTSHEGSTIAHHHAVDVVLRATGPVLVV